jgi:hypothetical protein
MVCVFFYLHPLLSLWSFSSSPPYPKAMMFVKLDWLIKEYSSSWDKLTAHSPRPGYLFKKENIGNRIQDQ